jgi:predicted NAD/FAD-dependent oxidoreductase
MPLPATSADHSQPVSWSVAIVGAGVAGLSCASVLRERARLAHDVQVTVFDKGRAPGGRLAGYRSAEFNADVGAPYFTVRDERFGRVVRSWLNAGVVALWPGRIRALAEAGAEPVDTPPVERFVGTPNMNAIARHLAQSVPVRTGHRVDRLERRGHRLWVAGVVDETGATLAPRKVDDQAATVAFGEFDAVIVCLPSDQAQPLVRQVSPALADVVGGVRCAPCVALGFVPEGDALRGLPFDGLFVGRDGEPGRVVSWLGRESSKPHRRGDDAWVVHADAVWSAAHLRDPQEALEAALVGELTRLLRLPPWGIRAATLRRWAFARVPSSDRVAPVFDPEVSVAVGGDWTGGGRVEGAWLSGVALAEQLLGHRLGTHVALGQEHVP